MAQISEILDNHASEHVKILEKLSRKPNLPPQAVLGMLKHLDKAKGRRDRARGKMKAAKDKTAKGNGGPPAGQGLPESNGLEGS